jgi:hypothetical protein
MATATNVTAAKPKAGGAVSVAAITATLPTDTTSALTGFTNLGYISDAGATKNITPTASEIRAWGGDVVLTATQQRTITWQFNLIEALNPNVISEIYGAGNVSGTLAAGLSVEVNSEEMPDRAWVVDMVLRGNVACRVVLPYAHVSAIDAVTYSDSAAVGYNITLTCMPDASGNSAYEYYKS